MQELFRFYAIRSPELSTGTTTVDLATTSNFQKSLGTANADPSTVFDRAQRLLTVEAEAVAADHKKFKDGLSAFAGRLAGLSKPGAVVPQLDVAVREDFKDDLVVVVREAKDVLPRLKDVLAALRIAHILAPRLDRAMPAIPNLPAASLLQDVRLWTALTAAAASNGKMTLTDIQNATRWPIIFKHIDWALKLWPLGPVKQSPAQIRAAQLAELAQLEQLIREVVAACPGGLRVLPPGPQVAPQPFQLIVLADDLRQRLANSYQPLITSLNALPGSAVDLGNPWLQLHANLLAKATLLQNLLDQSAPTAPAAPAAPQSPVIGGHMQLAGVADVHVVLSHIVAYDKMEVAQIENILLGEKRDRTFRTLNRSTTDTENTTETTTTQEKDVKTEDRSDLKTEVDSTLKEALQVKAGLDVTYTPSKSLTLKMNASVDYSRNKDEANKVSSDFAKDVTNTAVNKVVTAVKTSVKVQTLFETEETVVHDFDNPAVPGSTNISGVYRWIQQTHENVHLTVGGPSAIFDGIVLQPAQRLLQQPLSSGTSLGGISPPPKLDVLPSAIHPWSYLGLAARFGAATVPAPPPLYSTTSFSNAAAGTDPMGLTKDIPTPADTMAAWAWVIWDAEDNKGDGASKPNANARASLAGTKMVGDVHQPGDDTAHSIYDRLLLLSGQNGTIPFAALFYDTIGYECTVEIGCVRTPEAYQAWQLQVYAALATARAQAQQAYDDQAARAQLQKDYDYGPSPGQVDAMIKEEIKRCALGVLATQVSGKNLFDQLSGKYTAGDTTDVARLCLIFEHAFAWEDMSYVLYPYFWSDPANDGWAVHTAAAAAAKDENWADFLRAGAARVVVPVRDGFIRAAALGLADPNAPSVTGLNPLQLLQEDISKILDATLSFDDLLSINSPMALSAAQESALDAGVIDQWTEVNRWKLATPTELVMLQPLTDPLPKWQWDPTANLAQGVADAWVPQQP